ncbi:MAG: ABC transporter permease [Chloroflexota bacterium]|nr:ABC transporter permease [Chloroflexota bacterium]
MGLNKIAIIAWHEYVVNVRRIGFIFVTLLFPTLGLLALVVGALFGGQAAKFLSSQFTPAQKKAGIVDQSRLFTPIPAQFAIRYVEFPDEATAKAALLNDTIGSFVVIPSDYLATGKLTNYMQAGFSNITNDDPNALRAFLVSGLLAGKVDPALLARASKPADTTLVTLDSKGTPTTGAGLSIIAGFVAPYIFSIMLFIAVFSSSGYLLRSITDEKETRVIEIVLSSVAPTELLAGKVIGLGALGLTQVAVWLVSSFALSGGMGAIVAGAVLIVNPGNFMLAALYFLLGYLLFGTLMATAGAVGTNPRESQQLAGIFSFAAAIPWFFASILFANPNATLARALSFFPLTAPTTMMLRLPLGGVPAIDIIVSLIVLLISIPIVVWAGARIFRVGLLMYGKRPSVREIASALKSA